MANVWKQAVGSFIACGMALAPPASAQSVAQFYKGRTVTLIVSTSVGGSYDNYGRLLHR